MKTTDFSDREIYRIIYLYLKEGVGPKKLAERTGLNYGQVSQLCQGKVRKHIYEDVQNDIQQKVDRRDSYGDNNEVTDEADDVEMSPLLIDMLSKSKLPNVIRRVSLALAAESKRPEQSDLLISSLCPNADQSAELLVAEALSKKLSGFYKLRGRMTKR